MGGPGVTVQCNQEGPEGGSHYVSAATELVEGEWSGGYSITEIQAKGK